MFRVVATITTILEHLSHLLKRKLISSHSPLSPNFLILELSLSFCQFWTFHACRITQHISFCDWLFHLAGFFQLHSYCSIYHYFVSLYCQIVFHFMMCHILFIRSSIDVHLSCFHFLIVTNAAMNTCVQVFMSMWILTVSWPVILKCKSILIISDILNIYPKT